MPVPLWQRLLKTYRAEIWDPRFLGDKSLRGRFYAVSRVVSITFTGISETNSASRAAALSFSSLLGLGPLVAIAMLVAGFMLDKQDPNLAAKTLSHIIEKIAPQIRQLETSGQLPATPDATSTSIVAATTQAAGSPAATDNPELIQMLDGFVASSRNGTVGAVGAITLIVIVLQLFTSVETSFNEIWGVRRGRSWIMRIVLYWTVLTLGAVLFFAAVTGLGAGAMFNAFETRIPFGSEFVALLKFFLPAGSLLILVAMLTIFYRTIPNTHVWWRAALAGALVVAALIVMNNFLAFLYLKRVVLQKSLYGSLGLLPILMFGLYVFWFFVLLGGQVSYAVQNVNFRNSQAAWNTLAESMRERLSLIVLLLVSRRFQACQSPFTASQLSTRLKVPTQILNECINRLVLMNLVTPIPPKPEADSTDLRYQPARPLNRISLGEFKRLDDDFGGDPSGPLLADLDPIVTRYNETVQGLARTEFFKKTLDELLAEHPVPAT
ncbi:YihY/virulence factor BrkB family protein [Rariglobus hedericola]|uniref:YihY/virulence factor BrkB family protein n=1 Tax=Rariglobus hedericola TaxID=2597822 RepID=A0A556QEG2_9BACT|nr:YihY/virulence factor BrkB family protein [Rariglobus hedericola]TSJ75018.1 YihY/virulence factor BrkB family protein [Rariglobus hedericola]